jgi:4-hydroxy-tetrahydrodipicolinate synthase
VTGITVLGMMGEANEMTCQERRDVIDTVVGRADDLPVVVGISDDG